MTREKEHAQSRSKYVEFPSLRDCHQKLEKRDAEDLAALRKEINVADSHWLSSAEGFATTLLQVVAELLQQDKDRRLAASVSKPSSTDGLEVRLNSRLDALGKQHKEEVAKQQKQIEDLQKGLSTEIAQRKILGIENDSLKKKIQELQSQKQSLVRKVDEHGTLIKQLQEEKSKETPLPPAPQEATVTAEDLKEVKTIADRCRSGLADLEATVTGHDQKLGEIDVDLITDGCVTIAATLPRLEQHAKRAADDISGLRSDHDRLRLDNEKLRSNADILQSSVQQLQSGTQQLRSDAFGVQSSVEQLKSVTDQLKHDTESLKTDTLDLKTNTQDLRTDTKGLKSDTEHLKAAAEQLKSTLELGENAASSRGATIYNTETAGRGLVPLCKDLYHYEHCRPSEIQ
ncbi:alpha (1,3)-fucosyltransferase 3 [Colletotrichum higginsianum]|nr:alpha (1,3)-fucosyltransferase 3 [Colletotrichum higginsianum]